MSGGLDCDIGERNVPNRSCGSSRLGLKELKLTLHTATVVLPGTLEIVVHLLYVRHQIGEVGAFNSKSLVLPDKANLNALQGLRVSRGLEHCMVDSN